MTLLQCIILSSLLFSIGVYGVITRRNIIAMLMSVELMINASIINFIAFAHFRAGEAATEGSIFSVFIMAVSACEMAVALAIVVGMYRRHKNLDIRNLRELNG